MKEEIHDLVIHSSISFRFLLLFELLSLAIFIFRTCNCYCQFFISYFFCTVSICYIFRCMCENKKLRVQWRVLWLGGEWFFGWNMGIGWKHFKNAWNWNFKRILLWVVLSPNLMKLLVYLLRDRSHMTSTKNLDFKVLLPHSCHEIFVKKINAWKLAINPKMRNVFEK